jgi:hypothetical protein
MTMEWERFFCVIRAMVDVMVVVFNEGAMVMKGMWWGIYC